MQPSSVRRAYRIDWRVSQGAGCLPSRLLTNRLRPLSIEECSHPERPVVVVEPDHNREITDRNLASRSLRQEVPAGVDADRGTVVGDLEHLVAVAFPGPLPFEQPPAQILAGVGTGIGKARVRRELKPRSDSVEKTVHVARVPDAYELADEFGAAIPHEPRL